MERKKSTEITTQLIILRMWSGMFFNYNNVNVAITKEKSGRGHGSG